MLPVRFLKSDGVITEWDPIEWCQWLFPAAKTPAEHQAGFCGLMWDANVTYYRCNSCGFFPNISLCSECFQKGNHKGHISTKERSQAGGYCDCGIKSAMAEVGFCPSHPGQIKLIKTPEKVLCVAEALRPQLLSKFVQELRKTILIRRIDRRNGQEIPLVEHIAHLERIADSFTPHLFSRLVQYLNNIYDDQYSNKSCANVNEPDISLTTLQDVSVSQALGEMLNEGYLSDFKLKVDDRIFPVHKNVLGVRSKVFRAMFDSEMKETQDNCVLIKDFDGDTIHRMLDFIYTDTLNKDMDWNDASSLYAAADFYELEPLKQGCSSILKDGLNATNALGILSLADLHQDWNLKSFALDFISLNDQKIVDTETWVEFEEKNPKLAMETLRKLYVRKMKG